jgi:hypothetical protein
VGGDPTGVTVETTDGKDTEPYTEPTEVTWTATDRDVTGIEVKSGNRYCADFDTRGTPTETGVVTSCAAN